MVRGCRRCLWVDVRGCFWDKRDYQRVGMAGGYRDMRQRIGIAGDVGKVGCSRMWRWLGRVRIVACVGEWGWPWAVIVGQCVRGW